MRQTMVDAFRNARFFHYFRIHEKLNETPEKPTFENVAASLYESGSCGTVKAVARLPSTPGTHAKTGERCLFRPHIGLQRPPACSESASEVAGSPASGPRRAPGWGLPTSP